MPLALYVNASNRLMVDGYEVHGKRVRWRELAVDRASDVRPTAHTYLFDSTPTPIRKTYPKGTAVIERATLD